MRFFSILIFHTVQRPPCLMNLPMLFLCQQGTVKVTAAGRTLREKTHTSAKPVMGKVGTSQPLNHNTGFPTKNEKRWKKPGSPFASSFSHHDVFLMTLRVTHGKHVLRRTNFRQSPEKPKQREYIFNTETQNEMWKLIQIFHVSGCLSGIVAPMLWVGCKLASLQNRKL